MNYKTIVLELLQNHPAVHHRLAKTRSLLLTVERYASELRNRHAAWKEHLQPKEANRNEISIASEALELALAELTALLTSEFPLEVRDPPNE